MGNGNKLRVEPEELIRTGESLDVPRETIRRALDAFYSSTGGLPAKPWGDDEPGLAFETIYEDPTGEPLGNTGIRGHKKVLQLLSDLTDGLQNVEDKTIQMGENYILNEDANRT
jgi:hypothetical protein